MSNTAIDRNTDAAIRSGISTGGDIDLAYEDWGDTGASPILLIMGVGGQMLLWPDGFCGGLVEAGFRVIRFDNRDVGLSGRTTESSRLPQWLLMTRVQLGLRSTVPYSLLDMAKDAIRLLDHLQIRKAHIVGASMGG